MKLEIGLSTNLLGQKVALSNSDWWQLSEGFGDNLGQVFVADKGEDSESTDPITWS